MNICFMDSGVGGYATYLAFCDLLIKSDFKRNVNLFYFADYANSPYGAKTRNEICKLMCHNVATLQKRYKIDIFVLACNTATACAIKILRKKFPHSAFVGVEPAIKMAAGQKGKTLILVTTATYFYSSYVRSYLNKRDMYFLPLTSIAREIDAHINDCEYLSRITRHLLAPFEKLKINNIVLGCTHYNFIAPHILELLPNARLFEPSRAVARQIFSKIIA